MRPLLPPERVSTAAIQAMEGFHADIVDQVRQACRALAERGPLVVSGHSAGGHLAACLLATDWRPLGLPADLVRAAYAISGLFDLKPLVATTVNTALGMVEPEAERRYAFSAVLSVFAASTS